jgi:hypothetical protein
MPIIYFNDYIALIVDPVFYIDKALKRGGSRTLQTTLLDVDVPLGKYWLWDAALRSF